MTFRDLKINLFYLLRVAPHLLRYSRLKGVRRGGQYHIRSQLRKILSKSFRTEGLNIKARIGIEFPMGKVSIIIPTKNAGPEFEKSLDMINRQKGTGSVEIIVVDSDSEDETPQMAKRYGAKVLRVPAIEFNHGLTRNFGAEHSSGNPIVFTVQDAVPVDEYWIESMILALRADSKIAAVSCRQYDRADADLFARFRNFQYYDSMGLRKNEVRYVNTAAEFFALLPTDRRRVAQIDDVCTCYRRNIFNAYRFRDLPYCEDLDMGVRLAVDGHKLAFVLSNGVVHSHNRSSTHFLKRGYVDRRLVPGFLKSGKDYPFLSIWPEGMALTEFLSTLKSLYFSIGFALKELDRFDKVDFFAYVEACLRKGMGPSSSTGRVVDEDLESFFPEFESRIDLKIEPVEGRGGSLLRENFLLELSKLRDYVTRQEHRCMEHRNELTTALNKLFGLWVGLCLGEVMKVAERRDVQLNVKQIDAFLFPGL